MLYRIVIRQNYAQIWWTWLLQVLKSEIDGLRPKYPSMKPERQLLPCDMIIRWKGKRDKGELTVLKRQVKLVGAQEPCNSFTLFVDPNHDAQETGKWLAFDVLHWNFNCSFILPTSATSPRPRPSSATSTEIQAILSQDKFADYVASAISTRWFEFGFKLNIPYADLVGIERSFGDNPLRCFLSVFHQWECDSKMPFTWATVVDILSSNTMNEQELAEKIRKIFPCNIS